MVKLYWEDASERVLLKPTARSVKFWKTIKLRKLKLYNVMVSQISISTISLADDSTCGVDVTRGDLICELSLRIGIVLLLNRLSKCCFNLFHPKRVPYPLEMKDSLSLHVYLSLVYSIQPVSLYISLTLSLAAKR